MTWIRRRTKFRGGGNGTARLCLASCKAGVVGGVESGVRGDQTLLLLTYPKFPCKDFGLPPPKLSTKFTNFKVTLCSEH